MRIKRQGTAATRRAGKAGKSAKAKGAAFRGLIEQTVGDPEEGARKVRCQLFEELELLAADLEGGEATKEEASRRFVGLVIKDRFGKNAAESKGGQVMSAEIGDLVEDDPQFVSRLQQQLKKIAKG